MERYDLAADGEAQAGAFMRFAVVPATCVKLSNSVLRASSGMPGPRR
jgi:hypothetical protein